MSSLDPFDKHFINYKPKEELFNNNKRIEYSSKLNEIDKLKEGIPLIEKNINKKELEKISKDKLIKNLVNSYITPSVLNPSNNFNQANLFSALLQRPANAEDLISTLPDEIKGKGDISTFSMQAKRTLLHVVSRLNTTLFNQEYREFPILPKNKDEYCALMQQLAQAVSIEVLPVDEKDIQNYYVAMKNLETILPTINIDSLEINLKMPREVFIARASTVVNNLPEKEQKKVFDYFGFELKDGKMSGYPVNIPDKEIVKDASFTTRQAIENMRSIVDKFTTQNKVILPLGQKPLEDALNDVIKVFPEFLTTIGKKQHGTHTYTLDLHILKVLQETIKNPEYKKLTDDETRIFNIAVLLHDISKAEGVVDKSHPYESALDIACIIQKLNLSENEKERIVNIVKNHHWLEQVDHVDEGDDETLKSIAFSFRKPHDFSIAKIFAEADLKGVSDEFFEKHKKTLYSNQMEKIGGYLDYIYETGVYFPQTNIPRASKLGIVPSLLGIGNEQSNNVVVDLRKNPDLESMGFGDSKFRTFVHVFNDYEVGAATLKELAKEMNEGVLSTSYIDRYNYGTYWSKEIGVLLEAEPTNILQAGDCNLTSGKKKGLKGSILRIFDSGESTQYGKKDLLIKTNERAKFASKIKSKLNITGKEYAELYQKLLLAPDFSFIPKNIRLTIEEVADSYLKSGSVHNEITVLAPKVKGIFVKDKNADSVPYVLRKFAQENDLPIIIFGDIP